MRVCVCVCTHALAISVPGKGERGGNERGTSGNLCHTNTITEIFRCNDVILATNIAQECSISQRAIWGKFSDFQCVHV